MCVERSACACHVLVLFLILNYSHLLCRKGMARHKEPTGLSLSPQSSAACPGALPGLGRCDPHVVSALPGWQEGRFLLYTFSPVLQGWKSECHSFIITAKCYNSNEHRLLAKDNESHFSLLISLKIYTKQPQLSQTIDKLGFGWSKAMFTSPIISPVSERSAAGAESWHSPLHTSGGSGSVWT